MIQKLITSLLDDEHGITSEAYGLLLEYLAHEDMHNLIEEVNNCVKSANGRYYFAEGTTLSFEKREDDVSTEIINWNPNDPKNW